MIAQEFLEAAACQQFECLFELVHTEQEESETCRQPPNVNFGFQAQNNT